MNGNGTNVKTSVTGNKLTIEIDLSAPGTISNSGKTLIVASTHGFKPLSVNGEIASRELSLSLNLTAKR